MSEVHIVIRDGEIEDLETEEASNIIQLAVDGDSIERIHVHRTADEPDPDSPEWNGLAVRQVAFDDLPETMRYRGARHFVVAIRGDEANADVDAMEAAHADDSDIGAIDFITAALTRGFELMNVGTGRWSPWYRGKEDGENGS